MPKRIAFVDYKLDNFHANTFSAAIREPLKERGYTIVAAHSLDHASGRAWCEKKNIPYIEDPQQLAQVADVFMILAPSHPETHLDLARKILPFGKPTYIDKTFAPDLATAKQIFELADQHRTPVQTTSALRYTAVQAEAKKLGGRDAIKHMIAFGGGSSFAEYAIHPVEMVVSIMGPDASGMMRRGTGDYSQLLVNFSNDRTAVINLYVPGNTPYAATLTTAAGTHYMPVDLKTLFVDMASAILDFFDKGEPNIDRNETLAVRRILDAAADSRVLREFTALT
jgi:predicted dehydrogenase